MKTAHTVTIKISNIEDTQRNIDAINKAIEGKPLSIVDTVLLLDTISVLTAIKKSMEANHG